MSASTALTLLLVLACPLMMVMMMRGHGSHGRGGCHGGGDRGEPDRGEPELSADELRRIRDRLGARIEELEERDASRRATASGFSRDGR